MMNADHLVQIESDLMNTGDDESGSSSSLEVSGVDEEKRNREASGLTGTTDPESPNSKADSTSSEGVLVEHPVNVDQEDGVGGNGGDPDSGILVNIDGSMQENLDGDDASREDSFVDAPDDLAFVEGRSSRGLEDFIATIATLENTGEKHLIAEVNRLHSLLAESLDECSRYKGEQELLGKEICNIQFQLKAMIDRDHSMDGVSCEFTELEIVRRVDLGGDRGDDPMSLHSMLRECSAFASHLRVSFDEQLQSEGMIRELRAVLDSKDEEIDNLNAKLSQNLVSHDVVASYLGSIRNEQLEYLSGSYDAFVKRLLASLASVVHDNEVLQDSAIDEVSLVEKKTFLLIERYSWFYYYTEQLRECLSGIESKFSVPQGEAVSVIFDATRNELFESKTRESYYIEKINVFEQKKKIMFEQLDMMKKTIEVTKLEASKAKMELEQTEQKFLSTKEKLGLAVSKGKSLVQQRDSLRQLLAEKTIELEKCLQELKQKSEALEAYDHTIQELRGCQDMVPFLQNTVLEKDTVLHAMEAILCQSEVQEDSQMNIVDRIRWLVDRERLSEEATLEKDSLKVMNEGLASKYEDIVDRLSKLSLEKTRLMRALGEASEGITSEETVIDIDTFVERCLSKIRERMNALSEPSSAVMEEFQRMQSSLYVRSLESAFCQQMLEEQMIGRREVSGLLDKLRRVSEEATGLRTERDAVQKDLKCSEEKSSLIRDKLTLAVKKGKGLVQERDSLKRMLDEKNYEIEKLKHLQEAQKSTIIEYKEHIEILTDDLKRVEMLELGIASMKAERDQIDDLLLKSNGKLQNVVELIEQITPLPGITFEGLIDRVKYLVNHVFETEAGKIYAEKELEKVKEEITLQASKLSDAYTTIRSLEGLKTLIHDRNSENEKLKHEMKVQETMLGECKEQIKILTYSLKRVEQLESEIVSLKDERDQIEQRLLERNATLQQVIESVEQIIPQSGITFEGPIQKVKYIMKHAHETEVRKLNVEKEMGKVKEEVTLKTNKLSDAYLTIRSLEDALSQIKTRNNIIMKEKVELQLTKSSIELMLQKVKEEADMQTSELQKAYNTVRLLEEDLSNERNNISLLIDQRNELDFKTKHEIMTLNAKIAECMEELTGTSGTLEKQTTELRGQFRHLLSLTKDESLIFLINERLQENLQGLNSMIYLIESIHNQLSEGMGQTLPGLKQHGAIVKLLSLPKFEDQISDKTHKPDDAIADTADDIPSFTRVLEEITSQTRIIDDYIAVFSGFLRNQFTLLVQSLEEIRGEVMHVLDLRESDRQTIDKLEASCQARNVEILSIQNELKTLNSACSAAIQILQIKFEDILDLDYSEEISMSNGVSMGETCSREKIGVAENLLVISKRVKDQVDQFSKMKNKWRGSVDDLRSELEKAKITTEFAATQDKDLQHERNAMLEGELHSLQRLCTELKSMIDDYKARENMWKDKEKDLRSKLVKADLTVERNTILEGELHSLRNLCTELKSRIGDYKTREDIWKDKEKDLRSKLVKVELSMESAMQDKAVQNERITILDGELELLQKRCNQLKSMVDDYEEREVTWKEKEKELYLLQNEVASKHREEGKMLVLEGQLETLFDKVNKIDVRFKDFKMDGKDHSSSTTTDKVLYILNSIENLLRMMNDLVSDKENLRSALSNRVEEVRNLKMEAEKLVCSNRELEISKNDLHVLTKRLETLVEKSEATDSLDDKRPFDVKGLLLVLERLVTNLSQESAISKSKAEELAAKLVDTQKIVDESSAKIKFLENSVLDLSALPESKKRKAFESSSSTPELEISEIGDSVGPHGKSSISPVPAAATHVRQMRKVSPDHLVVNIDTASEGLIPYNETDDKGHVFKSLNTSGFIPKQGKLIADRVDGIWVSGGRILMGRPGARLSLITYWIILHIWVLVSIL